MIGKYSFDGLNFLKFNILNNLKNDLLKIELDGEYGKNLKIDIINYEKPKNSIADVLLKLEKNKDDFIIKKLLFSEKRILLILRTLNLKIIILYLLKRQNLKHIKKIILTMILLLIVKIKSFIFGTQFDATYLPKILNNQNSKNLFSTINSDIEIDLRKLKLLCRKSSRILN